MINFHVAYIIPAWTKTLFSIHECKKCLLIYTRSFTLSFNSVAGKSSFYCVISIYDEKHISFVNINYAIKVCGKNKNGMHIVLLEKSGIFSK